MLALTLFQVLLVSLLSLTGTLAANSWAGTNLYYAAGLSSDQQDAYFQKLRDAGIKVLRVWLDGQTSDQKGTQITHWKHLEQDAFEGWDDTVLNLLDDVMTKASQYGIKLLISLHSENSLKGDNADIYGKTYGTGDFYEKQDAIDHMKTRINYVLSHVNPNNNKPWSQCSEYIFAFEAQNEAFNTKINDPSAGPGYATQHAGWQCTMSDAIKSALNGNTDILITTGGGGWLSVSLQDAYWPCDSLDVIAIHAYSPGDYDTSTLQKAVDQATSSGKKLLFQEWGACYWDSSPNSCLGKGASALDEGTRLNNFKTYADQISKAGIPWMYWQIIPNNDPHGDYDYEIGVTEDEFNTFQSVAKGTTGYSSPFDYSEWL